MADEDKLKKALDEFFDARGIKGWTVNKYHLLQVEQQELNDPPPPPEWYDELMKVIKDKGLDTGPGEYDSLDLLAANWSS